MLQSSSNFSGVMEAANHLKNSAMEAENHVKHGASSKSQMSKGNFKLFAIFAFVANIFVFTGCDKRDDLGEKINDLVPTDVMASFAKASYNDNLYRLQSFPIKVPCSNSEWELSYSHQAKNWDPKASDFWYQIYESDKAIVIAFRGTPIPFKEGTTLDHWWETLVLTLGNNHPQDKLVRDEVEKGEISEYLKKGKKIFLTGHSLGGHLAMIAYLHIQGCGYDYLVGKVETFNAVGIKKVDANLLEKNGVNKVRQWHTCCDIAKWGSEVTIAGFGELYFPTTGGKRPIVKIKDKNPLHICSTPHFNEFLMELLLNQYKYLLNGADAINGILAHGIDNFNLCEIEVDPTILVDEIVGVWKGVYGSGNQGGTVTITINEDMTGVNDFVHNRAGCVGSYKVSVTHSNGVYNIIGTAWIINPGSCGGALFWSFANLTGGVINNGVLTGSNGYVLEKVK